MYRVFDEPTLRRAGGRAHLERMLRAAWVKNRLPDGSSLKTEPVKDVFLNSTSNHCNALAMPRLNRVRNPIREVRVDLWNTERSCLDACHAIAHMIQPGGTALHGREFARALLDVVGRFGYDPADKDTAGQKRVLSGFYKQHGIKARIVSEETRAKRSEQWKARKEREAIANLLELSRELGSDE